MNQSLRPQPLLSEILPGALMLGLLLLDYFWSRPDQLNILVPKETSPLLIGAGAFLLLSWIVGTFFDSIRNLFEHLWDRISEPLNWSFFFKSEREKVFQLEEHYFAYYTLNSNYVISIVLFFAFKTFLLFYPSYHALILALCPISVLIFLTDAFCMRKEIQSLLNDCSVREPCSGGGPLPHEGACTRLKRSELGGVGVFAIREIPAGTNLFIGDTSEMVEFDPEIINTLNPELQQMYRDFCVFKSGKMHCPTNFNSMTIGWYINHSDQPSVRCDREYNFFAMRNIQIGEELTVDYSTYSDLPPGRSSFTSS